MFPALSSKPSEGERHLKAEEGSLQWELGERCEVSRGLGAGPH